MGPMTVDTRLTPHMFHHIHTRIPIMVIDPTVNRVLMLIPMTTLMIIRRPAASVQHLIVLPGHPLTDVGVQVQVWTRLGLLSRTKIYNILHIDVLLLGELTAFVVHYPFSVMTRPLGVQVQTWTQLGLLSTMKIGNFFHTHLLLTYRVTEAYTTPRS